jgi:hypothetical protein
MEPVQQVVGGGFVSRDVEVTFIMSLRLEVSDRPVCSCEADAFDLAAHDGARRIAIVEHRDSQRRGTCIDSEYTRHGQSLLPEPASSER